MPTQTAGRYIVADPDICHDELTFRGMHILVMDVLEPVESDMVGGVGHLCAQIGSSDL